MQSLPGVPGPRVMRAFMLKKEMMDMLVILVMLVMLVMGRRITNSLHSRVRTGHKTMMVMWVRMTIRMKKQMRMNVDLCHQDRECTLSPLCSLRQGIVGGSDSSPKLSPEMIKKIKVMKTKKRV